MLFFGVDRFAEFLIFQKNKVFFFYDRTSYPTQTLDHPQTLYRSSSPAHGYPHIGVFARRNPSLSIFKKCLQIGLWPLENLINKAPVTLNRVLQAILGVSEGTYVPQKVGLPSSQGSSRQKIPKRPLKRHKAPLMGYQLVLYTLNRGQDPLQGYLQGSFGPHLGDISKQGHLV